MSGERPPRGRTCVPPPHMREHVFQAVQFDTRQSTTHGAMLQFFVSVSAGQAVPAPPCGTVTTRVRVCVPPPQLCVQFEKGVQEPTVQFASQFGSPQLLVFTSAGHAATVAASFASAATTSVALCGTVAFPGKVEFATASAAVAFAVAVAQ